MFTCICVGRHHLPQVCGKNMPLDSITGGRYLVAALPGAPEHGPGGALGVREKHDKHYLKA